MTYAVIMAGGVGTRFWPKSRESRPKQFLKFFDEHTLFQNTVDRITEFIPHQRILVVTNQQYVDLVQQQIPDLPAENIIGEPIGKNTAPCIALAAAIVKERDPEGTMIVLPSDHFITKPDKFLSILRAAVAKANEGNNLVTIGIEPHGPKQGTVTSSSMLVNRKSLKVNPCTRGRYSCRETRYGNGCKFPEIG